MEGSLHTDFCMLLFFPLPLPRSRSLAWILKLVALESVDDVLEASLRENVEPPQSLFWPAEDAVHNVARNPEDASLFDGVSLAINLDLS